MHTLLVAANPDPRSLTHHVLGKLQAALQPGSVEIADLAKERFDPRFTAADRRAYRDGGNYPADVTAEHRRLERATDLVLIFPVYWWSMPALLKGWIDRVFVNGWAFEHSPASGLQPKLQGLTTHLLPIAEATTPVHTSATDTRAHCGRRSSTASSTTAAVGAAPQHSSTNPNSSPPRPQCEMSTVRCGPSAKPSMPA
ncbi:NAD(P)H-dependent oxidoreductase [Streptomyces radiopugnans]|nr:NAD(P)H-dependent oxidoreductase [Streptomyces radiopugnans]